MVGNPEVIRFIRQAARRAAILPLFPRRLQFPIPLDPNLLLMPADMSFGVRWYRNN